MLQRQCHAGEGKRSVLHENDLHDECDNPNAVEDRIGEDASEDVLLSVDLAAVDFVEERHQNEDIEYHREMLRWLEHIINWTAIVDIEKFRSWKKAMVEYEGDRISSYLQRA